MQELASSAPLVPRVPVGPAPSYAFLSPRARLRIGPPDASLVPWSASPGTSDLGLAMRTAFAESDATRMVGAIPFDLRQPSRLFLAGTEPLRPLLGEPWAEVRAGRSSRAARSIPSPAGYAAMVQRALAEIGTSALRKVVLGRILELGCERPPSVPLLVARMAAANPNGYTFSVDLGARQFDDGAEPSTLVGSSPELLLARTGRTVTSNPLAGTLPRSPDPAEDRQRAAALLDSSKDRREHAMVVDSIQSALAPWCRTLHVPRSPSLLATQTLWHLSTTITGEVADPSVTAAQLALAIHPTPAVCGTPTATARATVSTLEPFDRGFFTGLVGWCDREGDGEWALCIRAAELTPSRIRLFAGAGIVDGSDPERELAETEAKLHAILTSMGLD